MTRIGIDELGQNAAEWVRRARGGEPIEITDGGLTLARLLPPGGSDADLLAQMDAAGLIAQHAVRPLHELPAPLPARPQGPTLSEVLREMRDEERF